MKNSAYDMIICAGILASLLFFNCQKNDDLDSVVSWMTGSFSSQAQAIADSDFYDIRLQMARIWPERTDGYWLYVEQASAGYLDKPYRQRIYRVTKDGHSVIKSEVYTISDPLRFTGAWKDTKHLNVLIPDSLYLRKGCAVYLQRTAADTFKGQTKNKMCESNLRGAVYATSKVTITPDAIVSWDRGFDASGKQVWGSEKGGYVFDKMATEKERRESNEF